MLFRSKQPRKPASIALLLSFARPEFPKAEGQITNAESLSFLRRLHFLNLGTNLRIRGKVYSSRVRHLGKMMPSSAQTESKPKAKPVG